MNLTDREHPHRFFLDNLWLWKVGKREIKLNNKHNVDFEETKGSMQHFFHKMENRILVGAYRYGSQGTNFDYLGYLEQKLKMYRDTGNTEFLVDVANLAWLGFEHDPHPNKHFKADNSETNKAQLKRG